MEIAYQQRSQSLVLAGTVVPRIESTLGFRVAGKIVARTVDVGTIVKPGDLIAQLDPADYRLAVDNARAALASADADYARAKADHERYLNLRGSGAFTPQTLEQRQSLAATTLAQVEQARSQLASAENNLAYTELRADAAGVVTAVQAEVGQVMAQGQGVVRVARTDELEILVGVPEHRLKTVREAKAASFELWSDPGHRHAAKLRELSPSADPDDAHLSGALQRDRSAGVHRARHDRDAEPSSGRMPRRWPRCRCRRSSSAARSPPCGSSTGKAAPSTLRPVTIARWRDDTAAIASGVKDGEIIATAGVHKLEAGQKVKPVAAGGALTPFLRGRQP